MTDRVEVHVPATVEMDSTRASRTVVGIGASAGGLKALQLFFESVRVDSGMAYVVIMHLDPDRESRLTAILQDRVSIPVTQVNESTTVVANHIYIIPPGRDLEMSKGMIRVVKRGERPHHAPVDLLFRTLAESYGADAIGVVLSGTGSDGAAGIRHIKECGGITVAQAVDEAEYDGMPGAAIATGQIDLVLPAAQIPGELYRLRGLGNADAGLPQIDIEGNLAVLFSTLRDRTGHDFSLYKRSTVLRRLERRLRFNEVATLNEYLPILQTGESECRALVRDLLISVSGFFRDPEAFAALSEVIPALFKGKGPTDAVRVWVVGCATGEEAYSVGILLNEHAATLENPPQIQMFATDIDERGYALGREGLYPATGVTEIPPDRLRRFFVSETDGFRVTKPLREQVLFAVHNVLDDPPFSRIDLISCRNVLIYLQPEAQAQVIETFHYALRAGGLLFLGASESSGDSDLFQPAVDGHRIYRRDDGRNRFPPRLSAADLAPRIPAARGKGGDPHQAQFGYGPQHLRMLELYGPPSLIVDEQMEVVHVSAGAGRYLHIGEGEPSNKLIALSRGDLRMELRTALHQAFTNGLPTSRHIRLDDSTGRPLKIQVLPPLDGEDRGRFALVFFEEDTSSTVKIDGAVAGSEGPALVEPTDGPTVAEVSDELRQTKEQLETMSAAHDDTVEDLQAVNEELQSINEEARAAAEELETSREEIQSVNEELTTINQEHQNTIEELKRTNADLQNLVESTEIATIFLDSSMRVRRFTPAASELFNFVPTDRGRPLAHITHGLVYPALMEEAQSVLATQVRIEREVESLAGEWFIVRISPYRAVNADVDGAIITLFNNTAQKRVDEELRKAMILAESANLAKGDFLATLSHEFRTPLNAMLGYVELLGLDGPLSVAQEQRVERVKAGIWHLNSMIDEILSFAKLDEGQAAIVPEHIDAREIATEAKGLVYPQATAKGLEFVLDLPPEAVELETDRSKVRQIIINLCGNAVKYTATGEIRLAVRGEKKRVVFEVSDTGIGVAPENQVKIFDRFWQVEGASTRSFDGMGIGLAAAREFARLLSGDVEIESELGQGSTFRLWLPLVRNG